MIKSFKWLAIAMSLAVSIGNAPFLSSQSPAPDAGFQGQLRFVLILTRHGVRSPTWTNQRLDEYSKQPWPKWPVAPGLLTPHGKQLMVLFGAYDRAWLADRGLLAADGCADAAKVYLWADTDERTRETASGLANGLMPGCDLEVHALEGDAQDELFHAIRKPDATQTQTAFAALSGRIGNHPKALSSAYQAPLDQMQRALFDCRPSFDLAAQPCNIPNKKSLLALPPSVAPGFGDHLAELKGPLTTAAAFAENLQLEYLEGMPDSEVGWGRVNGAEVQSLMTLHAASSDLVQRTPTIARLQASRLLDAILHTMQQAQSGKSVPGAIGPAGERVVFLVGHDTNISNIASLLDAHWLVDGYQRDDAAPGGALVFELWRSSGKPDAVTVSYFVQTPDQMRHALPLSLTSPPAKANIFLPGCSSSEPAAPCSWDQFQSTLEKALGK